MSIKLTIDELAEYQWLQIPQLSKQRIPEILTEYHSQEQQIEFFKLLMQPENFKFTCKYLFNIDLLPFQQVILRELWRLKFPMLIGSRGVGKSMILALYALMRLVFHQGCKVVICGAGFRQSKIIFDYMENIYRNAHLLRDMMALSFEKAVTHKPDYWEFKIGSSLGIAIPIGVDGSKVRGLRSNYTLADEFACLGYNTLIETDIGILRIGDCKQHIGNINLINKNGSYEEPHIFNITKPMDTYLVTTERGYSFKCSDIHRVLTTAGFKYCVDLDEHDFLIFQNKYKFPEKYLEVDGMPIDEQTGRLMGILCYKGLINYKNKVVLKTTDAQKHRQIDLLLRTVFPYAHTNESLVAASVHRGWSYNDTFVAVTTNKDARDKLEAAGLIRANSNEKIIPWSILQSPKSVVVEFLRGFYDWGGRLKKYAKKNGKTYFAIDLKLKSKQLAEELQVVLKKLDVISSLYEAKDKKRYRLCVTGVDALRLTGLLQLESLNEVAEKISIERPKKYRIVEKDGKWLAQVAWRRKHMTVQTYATKREAEDHLDLLRQTKVIRVKSVVKLPEQEILYDFYLPKTHSFYGNTFIQHNTIPIDVYENVIAGFSSVRANVFENVKLMAMRRLAKEAGQPLSDEEDKDKLGNQSVLSGTAYYSFNHFYKYWQMYKQIIESRGQEAKLMEIFNGEVEPNFDWTQYGIIRMPYELIPEGMMDDAIVMRSKAMITKSIYGMEFGSVFSRDSDGFYKRSLIESCVTSNPVQIGNNLISFTPSLVGTKDRKYIFGIDPAADKDNFAVIILEIWPDHRRIVYSWTTDKKRYKKLLHEGQTDQHDYYSFCAKKIRALMKAFPCEAIALDSQGGGGPIMEALHDKARLLDGEQPIWEVIDPEKEKDSDGKAGLHIIHVINFASSEWVSYANHGMKFDFESKLLLFPEFDAISIGMSSVDDFKTGRTVDTLEDCVWEIEELKDELTTIELTQTSISGRERWDTPETKSAGQKKGRMKKDRYSALLMANGVARMLYQLEPQAEYNPVGGFAFNFTKEQGGPLYTGPDWIQQQLQDGAAWYGTSVRRNR